MPKAGTARVQSEPQFAALVDAIAADPARHEQLTALLREDHPFYDQRGAATVTRMRGWILLALARTGVSDTALIFVLEELDTSYDPYLVAAAARALRSCPRPSAALAPFVMRALANIRYRDDHVSFDSYGEYALSPTGTSPVRELLATLAWLGPHARAVRGDLEALRAPDGGLSRKLRIDLDRAIHAIGSTDPADGAGGLACCDAPPDAVRSTLALEPSARHGSEPIEAVAFEDHDGQAISFGDFFRGQPSFVVFFYTRCDNPMKCSLTVTKLARVQGLLQAKGLAEKIRTAAITYDPAYDLPQRLRVYGLDRGTRLDQHHRILRATSGNDTLRRHFELGVNFVETLVNRHRIEAYILDAEGRIAACFERIHWDEHQAVARTVALLTEKACCKAPRRGDVRSPP